MQQITQHLVKMATRLKVAVDKVAPTGIKRSPTFWVQYLIFYFKIPGVISFSLLKRVKHLNWSGNSRKIEFLIFTLVWLKVNETFQFWHFAYHVKNFEVVLCLSMLPCPRLKLSDQGYRIELSDLKSNKIGCQLNNNLDSDSMTFSIKMVGISIKLEQFWLK